jgi:hypothetical protein
MIHKDAGELGGPAANVFRQVGKKRVAQGAFRDNPSDSDVAFRIAACSGDVVWVDADNVIYKNKIPLGTSVRDLNFNVAATGDVAWIDNVGTMYKNTERLGSQAVAGKFRIYDPYGLVVWIDAMSAIYVDGQPLGSQASGDFKMASQTGDVAWTNTHHWLYKNELLMGQRAQNFQVNHRTGAVIWLDQSGHLRVDDGASPLADHVKHYELEDNNIIWIDDKQNLYRNGALLQKNVIEFHVGDRNNKVLWKTASGEQSF